MRVALLALPFLLSAAPALAQSKPGVPPELSDPKLAGRLTEMAGALGRAFLDLPVGELEAIAEGRQPTVADRRRTIRETAPTIERDLQEQLSQARPAIDASMKALSDSLPALMQSLQQAGEALDRAAANLPSPTYPKR